MTDQMMTHEQGMDELCALLTRAKELALHITDRAARAALSRSAVPAELAELLDRLSPPGHGIALKGDPTQTFHTGHDIYLAQRVKAWLHNQDPAPAVPEGWKISGCAGYRAGLGVRVIYRDGTSVVVWERLNKLLFDFLSAMLAAAPEPAEQHPDDAAVDQFAQVMKAKLAKARAKGRSGWDDPAQCSPEYLADLLAGHVRKGNDGNFVDVANFAMMLHQRGAAPSVMPDAIRRSTAEESSGDATAEAFDDVAEILRPYLSHHERPSKKHGLSGSVVESVQMLLDHWLATRPESAEGDSE